MSVSSFDSSISFDVDVVVAESEQVVGAGDVDDAGPKARNDVHDVGWPKSRNDFHDVGWPKSRDDFHDEGWPKSWNDFHDVGWPK